MEMVEKPYQKQQRKQMRCRKTAEKMLKEKRLSFWISFEHFLWMNNTAVFPCSYVQCIGAFLHFSSLSPSLSFWLVFLSFSAFLSLQLLRSLFHSSSASTIRSFVCFPSSFFNFYRSSHFFFTLSVFATSACQSSSTYAHLWLNNSAQQ